MSQASPSKEPSMDEILASIRRIIESSDEKPGAHLAAGRATAADRAASARDAAESSVSFAASARPARVVPFAERAPVEPPSAPEASLDSDERWMPPTEPANHAGEPPVGERTEASEPSVASVAALDEPVVSADRWAQELDDVQSWSVLDDAQAASEPAAEVASPAEAPGDPLATSAADAEPELEAAEPEHEAAAPAEATVSPVEPASPEFHAAASAEAAVSPMEPAVPELHAVENDDDFMVNFDEADFVEALDRNAALVTSQETRSETPVEARPAAAVADEPTAAVVPPVESPAGSSSRPPVFEARKPLFEAPATAESTVPEPSVMQQASAIMSEQAGLQVAAAFDDLTRAIRDGQMRSMEDMAREMLRPMLQEWLDDNLPRLVERLVREEIERVSRGGRR